MFEQPVRPKVPQYKDWELCDSVYDNLELNNFVLLHKQPSLKLADFIYEY